MRLSPVKAIRAKCLDCAGGMKGVRICPTEQCPLYPFRMGKHPSRKGIGGNPEFNKYWDKELKQKAAAILTKAIRDGVLTRAGTCSICGKAGKIHGHHPDYNKPLEVIWVCPTCHRQEHQKEIKEPPLLKWGRTKFLPS